MLGIIVPLLLILVSLGVIGFLVYKHYHQLRVVNVDSIPEIKEAKRKYEIVKKRLEDRSKQQISERDIKLVPLKVVWKKWQTNFRNYANKVADELREQSEQKEVKKLTELPQEEKQAQAKEKVRDATRAMEEQEYEFAEKCCIEAIRLDARNAEAYRKLAAVYIAQEQLTEAKETLHFLNQLDPNDDTVLLTLADIEEEMGNMQSAVDYLEQAVLINDSFAVRFARIAELLSRLDQYETALEAINQAVELEPQNPRYLDILVETAILCEQIDIAESGLRNLRTVNPDNQKIEILQDKIRILKEKVSSEQSTDDV